MLDVALRVALVVGVIGRWVVVVVRGAMVVRGVAVVRGAVVVGIESGLRGAVVLGIVSGLRGAVVSIGASVPLGTASPDSIGDPVVGGVV